MQVYDPLCFTGVEVELDATRGFELFTPFWNTIRDGSLHNNGREYLFPQPLRGVDVVTALVQLNKAFNKRNYDVSNDASMHVHIDVTELILHEVMRYIILYVMYEQVLFRYCSPRQNRESNIFCISANRSQELVTELQDLVGAINRGDPITHRFHNAGRYSAIGIHSVATLGTLEFRGHEATVDAELMLQWINILQRLKQVAKDSSIDWQRPYLQAKEIGIIKFTERVFGPYAPVLINYADFYNDVYTGMQLCRTIANASDPTYEDIGASPGDTLDKLINQFDLNAFIGNDVVKGNIMHWCQIMVPQEAHKIRAVHFPMLMELYHCGNIPQDTKAFLITAVLNGDTINPYAHIHSLSREESI